VPLPAVFTSSRCLEHRPGSAHPESPTRLRAVHQALQARDAGVLREASPATPAELATVHAPEYIDRIARLAAGGGAMLDPDTFLSPASFEAASAGAGAALAAVRHAHASGANAFAAIRPPGHHALASTAMGFCLFGNAVLAAREAQRLGSSHVLIVDWDVHHGNGTQALVEQDPTIRFISLHQWPHWPGTGLESERGGGNVFNLPRPAGLHPARYVEDLTAAIRIAVTDWAPGLVVISAGYDSMRGDPLGDFTLEPEHYAELVGSLRSECPGAPLVGVLEGGYVPSRIADGVMATLEAMA
jgi:acetoin utilization deacetylase AcuC-like enzyme